MKWTNEEISFLLNNYNVIGREECSKILNRSLDSISSKIRDDKIKILSKDRWALDEIKYLKNHYFNDGVEKCCKYLNRNRRSVISKANLLKLKTGVRKEKCETKTKKKVNYVMFENNINMYSAYILGLLWADGHIMKNQKRIIINCVESDILDVLPQFLKTGNWNISEPFKKYHNGHEVKRQITISTSTWGLWEILNKYDYQIKSESSPDKIIKVIPENLKNYWFRGYLDGDGCIRISKDGYHSVVFTGPFSQNWSFMGDLCEKLNIKSRLSKCTNKLGGYSHFIISRRADVIKLLNYIYFEFNGIGFSRKYKKYMNILNKNVTL